MVLLLAALEWSQIEKVHGCSIMIHCYFDENIRILECPQVLRLSCSPQPPYNELIMDY